jgi:hypothetical protein
MLIEFLYNETSQSRPDIIREHTHKSHYGEAARCQYLAPTECLQNVWVYTGNTNDPVSMCTEEILALYLLCSMNAGPCHHGMVHPQVADGGTASNMEDSCE